MPCPALIKASKFTIFYFCFSKHAKSQYNWIPQKAVIIASLIVASKYASDNGFEGAHDIQKILIWNTI